MSITLITLLIAIVVVALFVLGFSITRIRKGHDMESDVGGNSEMRRRGLECASAQIRREEAARLGNNSYLRSGCDHEGCDHEGCGTCTTESELAEK